MNPTSTIVGRYVTGTRGDGRWCDGRREGGQDATSRTRALRSHQAAHLARRRSAGRAFENSTGNSEAGVKGTLWAAYNGVTEYVDHRQNRKGEDRRFESVFFSEGYSIKTRALTVAQDLLQTWRN
ncbi:MAG TPA: DUF932 domain-containing protein [Chloroflexota bacterium]|nr:DUF932 domain-containing protein [Chloroflexota bacterium]